MDKVKENIVEKYLEEDKVNGLDKIKEKNILEVHAGLISDEDLEKLYEKVMDGISMTTPRVFVEPSIDPARYKQRTEELIELANMQRSVYEVQRDLYNGNMLFRKNHETKYSSCDLFVKQIRLCEIATQETLEQLGIDPECYILVPVMQNKAKKKEEDVKMQEENNMTIEQALNPSVNFVIKIKYFSEEIEKLKYIDGKSDWIDLRSAIEIELKAGEFKLIPLGIAMELPDGYEAHVVPRSSTFKNFGIVEANSMGIIDETYCGDNDQWFFPAIAIRDTVIHVNDRICQFRIMEHQPRINFEEVQILGNKDRGGHGSTGIQ